MKHLSIKLMIILLGLSLLFGSLVAQDKVPVQPAAQKHIDLVFAIDVSGSMEHIIAATQKKVWAIVNEMLKPKPMPIVRVGLIAYRGEYEECYGNKGFKVWDLNEDLDKVYAQLMELRTDNGDRECVGRAIRAAAHAMSWDPSEQALKVLFVLGNEPANQDSEPETYGYKVAASEAIKRGIQINTVYCSSNEQATPEWTEIARLADGAFTTIGLEGKVVEIATPMDKELAELQQKVNQTTMAFGGRAGDQMKEELSKAQDMAQAAPAGTQAERALALNKQKGGRIGTWDLIDAIKDGRTKLEKLKDEELPEEMQKIKPEERKAYLEKKQKEREELQKQIQELAQKRDAYIQEEMKKQKPDQDAFDQVIMKTLREQAKKKGFEFGEKEDKK